MLTCHSRKITGVFKPINDGCIPLRGGPGIVHADSLKQLTGTLDGIEPSLRLSIPRFT